MVGVRVVLRRGGVCVGGESRTCMIEVFLVGAGELVGVWCSSRSIWSGVGAEAVELFRSRRACVSQRHIDHRHMVYAEEACTAQYTLE